MGQVSPCTGQYLPIEQLESNSSWIPTRAQIAEVLAPETDSSIQKTDEIESVLKCADCTLESA